MPRKPLLLAAVSLIAFCLALPVTAPAQTAAALPFDLTRTHGFEGFGVQNWVTSEHPAALQAVLADTRAAFVRMGNLSPGLLPGDLRSGMTVQAMLAVMQQRQTVALAHSMSAELALLTRAGVNIHLVAWRAPAQWMTTNTFTSATGAVTTRYLINPLNVHDYANFVVAQVLFAVQSGYHLSFVEPANEPDGYWDTRWTPVLYAQMVHLVRMGLNAAGQTTVGIEGPGTSVMGNAPPFLAALGTDAATGDLTAVSVHAWDTAYGPDIAPVPPALTAAIAALPRKLPLHITEYSEDSPRWSAAPYARGPAQRGLNDGADSLDFGVSVVGETLQLVGDGATELSFWQAQDLSWGTDSRGLANLQGQMRPVEQGLRAALALVPASAQVAQAPPNALGVIADAFFARSNGVITAVTIGLANMSPSTRVVTPSFTGAPGLPRALGGETSFFNAAQNNEWEAPVSLVAGKLTVTLPPRSFVGLKVLF